MESYIQDQDDLVKSTGTVDYLTRVDIEATSASDEYNNPQTTSSKGSRELLKQIYPLSQTTNNDRL